MARWLVAPGSLSARLARAAPPFRVHLRAQGRASAWPGETAALGLPANAALVVREVLLRAGGRPCVFARSATSARAARGTWRAIHGLGQRPLAELLFSRRDVRRTPLAIAWLPAAHPEAIAVRRAWAECASGPAPAGGWWRRDSVFWRGGQGLRVAEYFPPASLAWLAPEAARRWPGRLRPGPAARA